MFITAIIATSIASIASAVSAAGTTIAAGVAAGATAAGATAAGAATAGAATAIAAAKGMGTKLATNAAKGAVSGVASGTMKELFGSDDSDDAGNNALSCIGTGIDLLNHGAVYTCAKKCTEHATRKVLK